MGLTWDSKDLSPHYCLKRNSNILKPEPYIHMFWCVNQSYFRPLDCLSWQLRYICSVLLWGNWVAEVDIFVTDRLRLLFWWLNYWGTQVFGQAEVLLGGSCYSFFILMVEISPVMSHDFLLAVPRGQHILTPNSKFGPNTSSYDALPTCLTSD